MRRVLSPLKSPVSATTVVNCLSWSRVDSILWRFTGDPDMASTAEAVAGARRPTMPRVSWPIGAKLSEVPPLETSPALVLGGQCCRPRPVSLSLLSSSLVLGYFPPVQGGWSLGAPQVQSPSRARKHRMNRQRASKPQTPPNCGWVRL